MAEVKAQPSNGDAPKPYVSKWSHRYRGAIIQDLDPPPALSLNPTDPITMALDTAFENDYTHLTIINSSRALLGYISIPQLQASLSAGKAKPEDPISTVMARFRRGGKGAHSYKTITMATPLEELEEFFEGGATGGNKQDFAVITDDRRRFVLGVATAEDLQKFVERRPAWMAVVRRARKDGHMQASREAHEKTREKARRKAQQKNRHTTRQKTREEALEEALEREDHS